MPNLTTLQLATKIANAVLAASTERHEPYRDAPTQAVLRTLRDADSWFCHFESDDDGCTFEYPYEQISLFDLRGTDDANRRTDES